MIRSCITITAVDDIIISLDRNRSYPDCHDPLLYLLRHQLTPVASASDGACGRIYIQCVFNPYSIEYGLN